MKLNFADLSDLMWYADHDTMITIKHEKKGKLTIQASLHFF